MKKAVALLLALSMVLALCGCGNNQKKDYEKAISLFDEGSYEEAQAIFEVLGDYEDSSSYVEKCKIEAKYAIKNTMTEEEFRDQCIEVEYAELLRNPNNYVGQFIKYECRILQLLTESNNEMTASANGKNSFNNYFDNLVHISYHYTDENDFRLIEKDIVVVYGIVDGSYTFISALGTTRTIPSITVLYYDFIKNNG